MVYFIFFDTHNRLSGDWVTMRVSCEDSPRVSKAYLEEMKQRYGEESNAYRIRVLGEFPRSDDDTVIPMELLEMAMSRDVSKAIDKMDAAEEQQTRRYRFTEWVRSTGITSKQIDEATGTNMGGHYTTAASQPAIMTREHLEACRHLLGEVPAWVEKEADIRSVESKNFAEREVVGQHSVPIGHSFAGETYQGEGNTGSKTANITAPSTDAAKQWQGWGTALKPALEPITVARKPWPSTSRRRSWMRLRPSGVRRTSSGGRW